MVAILVSMLMYNLEIKLHLYTISTNPADRPGVRFLGIESHIMI